MGTDITFATKFIKAQKWWWRFR